MITTKQDIAALIKQYLQPHQSAAYHMVVLPDQARQEGGWWYVVVKPSVSDISLSDYNARLEATEEDIKRHEHLNVLLVPVLPGD